MACARKRAAIVLMDAQMPFTEYGRPRVRETAKGAVPLPLPLPLPVLGRPRPRGRATAPRPPVGNVTRERCGDVKLEGLSRCRQEGANEAHAFVGAACAC